MSKTGREKHRTNHHGIRRFTGGVGKGILGVAGILGAMSLLSLLFLSLYQFALRSPLLRLETVLVEGADPVLEKELLAMGKLHTGLSLAGIRLKELKREMENHPWVRRVEVERRLPHRLVIHVEKERPLAIAVLEHLYFVNGYGELFKRVAPVDPVDFPLLTGMAFDSPELQPALSQAVRVLQILKDQEAPWTLEHLAEIDLSQRPGVSLYFSHLSARVEASADSFADNLNTLRRLAAYLEKQGSLDRVSGINLQYDDGAVAAFRKS